MGLCPSRGVAGDICHTPVSYGGGYTVPYVTPQHHNEYNESNVVVAPVAVIVPPSVFTFQYVPVPAPQVVVTQTTQGSPAQGSAPPPSPSVPPVGVGDLPPAGNYEPWSNEIVARAPVHADREGALALLRSSCSGCHAGQAAKGGGHPLFDAQGQSLLSTADRDDILLQVRKGQMPPGKPLDDKAKKLIREWALGE